MHWETLFSCTACSSCDHVTYRRGIARISRKGGLSRRKECARSAGEIFRLTTPTNYITLAGTKGGGSSPPELYAATPLYRVISYQHVFVNCTAAWLVLDGRRPSLRGVRTGSNLFCRQKNGGTNQIAAFKWPLSETFS